MYAYEGGLPPTVDFDALDDAVRWGADNRASMLDEVERLVVRWEWYAGSYEALEVDPFGRWAFDAPPRRLKKAPKVVWEQMGYGFDDRDRVVLARTGNMQLHGYTYEVVRLHREQRILEYNFGHPDFDRLPYYAEFRLDPLDRPVLALFCTSSVYAVHEYRWGPWGVSDKTRWGAERPARTLTLGSEDAAVYADDGTLLEVRRKQRYSGETSEFRVWPRPKKRPGHIYKHRLVFPRHAVRAVIDGSTAADVPILFVKDRGCYLIAQRESGSLTADAVAGDFDAMCGNDDFAHDVTSEVRSSLSTTTNRDLVVNTRVREAEPYEYELIDFTFE